MSAGAYRLDDLEIDIARRRVRRGDAALDVAGLSFDLLAYLLAQGDRVVGFDELIACVWAPAVVGEETVTQRVRLLRQALGDDGRNPRYLRSVRGKGYQLCSVPQPVADDVPAATAAASTATSAQKTSRELRWVLLLIALPLVALAVLMLVRRPLTTAGPASERDEVLQRARYYAGIGQKDDIDRAVNLYEELLRRDAGDHDAQLGLSFAYSTRVCLYNQAPEWAGRAQVLAEAVLEAEPRNSLAEAALGYAHDCLGDMAHAIAHYERAVALDPQARIDSAASLAYLYMVKGRLADALARNLDVEQRAGRRPRFLDIQIARNLELLGETAAAEHRYERSFRLYPDNVYSNATWPRCLFLQGRLADAETALAEAQRRSEHPELYLLRGQLDLLRGRHEAAAAAFAAAARLRPHASLPETLARLYALPAPDPAWLDQRTAEIVAASAQRRSSWPENQLELAVLQLARGDKAAAIAALRDAVEDGWRDRAYLQTSALFADLAAEPDFAALLEDIAGRVKRERDDAAASIAQAAAARKAE
ncbi:winged helix-turn-helix domain-containing protein [Tahibacter sp.]|uniref:winged helix-turn-helix domain-containing protein n=1 Tax=Tahibacter sp. TaxID=2056211 RepID=UPI0028C428EE|nr:winged helix-turn-helix domain-containing protein [Tahibacter sp.]